MLLETVDPTDASEGVDVDNVEKVDAGRERRDEPGDGSE
jgi:hypothetical protein